MKCPHCGIEIRDTMTVCMYCGGKIPQRKGTPPLPSGKAPEIGARGPAKNSAGAKRSTVPGDESGEEEEEGLTAYLQPGEQVLIGSLNVLVKKFFFHAYLTNQRVFLVDTQEKKLKVTARDVPLSTISGSIVEFSENSDPVLVLSIRSADDEIKTMKLVFAGNGLDRSSEIDEWVELLNEQIQPKKQRKPTEKRQPEPSPERPEEEYEGEEEQEAPAQEPPTPRKEPRPVKRPVKEYEKQPPVKRLLPVYQATGGGEMEDLPPQARPIQREISEAEEPKTHPHKATIREIPPSREPSAKPVRRVEVASAMKSALKTAAPQARSSAEKQAGSPAGVKKTVPVRTEPEPGFVQEQAADETGTRPESRNEAVPEEEATVPAFCQNCGKKLPVAANFCPGCGVRIVAHREKPVPKTAAKSVRKQEEAEAVQNDQKPAEPRPVRPPVKKVPKGSEMTILHKFLRR